MFLTEMIGWLTRRSPSGRIVGHHPRRQGPSLPGSCAEQAKPDDDVALGPFTVDLPRPVNRPISVNARRLSRTGRIV